MRAYNSHVRMRHGHFQLDLAAYRLLRDGRAVRLERQPMELLILLASRPGALVTREEIADRVWGDGVFVDVDHSINRIVAKLRLALHDDPDRPRFIETVVGKGYRLIAPLDVPIRSIAVLPFATGSENSDDQYFADGITEELITRLARVSARRIIPWASVDGFHSTTQPLHDIARELDVDAIVQGTVAADAGFVRITARLIQGAPAKELWTASYHTDRGDALAGQSKVAQAIAEHLRVALTPGHRPMRMIQRLLEKEPAAHSQSARDGQMDLTNLAREPELGPALPAAIVGKRTVAVLPLKLLTPGSGDEFLSVALADAIINHLNASGDVLVRPIAMVQRYAREATEPLRAARELNVQVLVHGNIQKVGQKLRVYLQAVDAITGSTLLAAKHDAEMVDLFALQDAIGVSVAKALDLDSVRRRGIVEDRPTGNRMAYELFLRAADKLSRLNQWDTRAAIDMLDSAVQLDRRFAAAWARMAEAHLLMAFTFREGSRAIAAAERAARQALALDPSNSVAQCSHGLVLWSPARGFQNKAALRALSIALKLNPGNLTARLWQCLIFLHVGLFAAAEEGLKTALAVRPDDATTVFFLGQSAMYRHHYAEADEYHARALAIDAAHTWTHVFYPVIPLYRGALEDAERKLASAREVQGDDPWLTSCEALLWAKRGDAAKAEQLLASALRGKPLFHTHHMWHTAAATYAVLGKAHRAVSLLERAAAFGLPNYTLFRDDPHFRPLHELPRFQKLLARLKRDSCSFMTDFSDDRQQ
jgi:TolB-like protein/Tfp pilus assembly protein PilF